VISSIARIDWDEEWAERDRDARLRAGRKGNEHRLIAAAHGEPRRITPARPGVAPGARDQSGEADLQALMRGSCGLALACEGEPRGGLTPLSETARTSSVHVGYANVAALSPSDRRCGAWGAVAKWSLALSMDPSPARKRAAARANERDRELPINQ